MTATDRRLGRFLLQMSGVPGSGKTTVATAVARATHAVILDHDISKSALLGAGVPVDMAGGASYRLIRAIAGHMLAQGHNVILDSPCRYDDILAGGQALAAALAIPYIYIECILSDLDELDRRLRSRSRHPSQLAGVRVPPPPGSGKTATGDALFREWMAGMKRPAGDYLRLDTGGEVTAVTRQAIAYVREQVGDD